MKNTPTLTFRKGDDERAWAEWEAIKRELLLSGIRVTCGAEESPRDGSYLPENTRQSKAQGSEILVRPTNTLTITGLPHPLLDLESREEKKTGSG
ncbi:unnamed protein product [Nezara viridula]|uniref:Uncharacterized protein n=1 Tax=Nezara viridula TaxID=85310 RepID=A0A9P0MNN7_NEZVI|nr:unnamed protein product [Nezara viridula]